MKKFIAQKITINNNIIKSKATIKLNYRYLFYVKKNLQLIISIDSYPYHLKPSRESFNSSII